jgi:hypothetical protein
MAIAGIARDSMTPMITSPECVRAIASANTAILFIIEVVADFAHHLPHLGVAKIAVAAKQLEKLSRQSVRLSMPDRFHGELSNKR